MVYTEIENDILRRSSKFYFIKQGYTVIFFLNQWHVQGDIESNWFFKLKKINYNALPLKGRDQFSWTSNLPHLLFTLYFFTNA